METKVERSRKAKPSEEGNMTPLLLRPKEVAERLGVSRSTLWRMRDAGKLPRPLRIGACVRWSKKALDEWIENGCPSLDGRIPKR